MFARPALLLAGLLAPAASAQSGTQAEPIVVQGTRDRDEQIRSFIKDLTPAYTRETLGRFESHVCPRAFGLAGNQNAEIEERIRQVARAAGLQVAKPGCFVNLALFIMPNKAAFLKELERWPFMFPEEWSRSRIRSLENDPSPVAAWQTAQVMWNDGTPLAARDTAAPNSHEGPVFGHAVATRLKPSAHPAFNKAVVVIQADALAGLTPVQVADYAAMRTLVRTDPKRADGQETILSILDAPMGSAVPQSLTAWDLSFLKAFYASRTGNYVEYQRSEMKGLMRRNLDARQSDGH